MMSVENRKYIFDKGWQLIFKDMDISVQDVLRHARLPLDLFSQKSPSLTASEHFRIWNAIMYVKRDVPTFPLMLGRSISAETFSPPMFACFCSDNLNIAAKRISYYKPLVGPLRLHITQNSQQTLIHIAGLPELEAPPASFMLMELVWWVQLARLATREHIIPRAVYTPVNIPEKEPYEDYFGVKITQDSLNAVAFTAEDADRPFLTSSEQMWSIFEPQLNTRMQELDWGSNFRERVRACLMEILASGQYSMADVATRLAVSSRTLQRRLREEDTNFQKELDKLREELARHYLSNSDYTNGQIAFLLGYEEPNSFFRAFRNWTGHTPELIRTTRPMD